MAVKVNYGLFDIFFCTVYTSEFVHFPQKNNDITHYFTEIIKT